MSAFLPARRLLALLAAASPLFLVSTAAALGADLMLLLAAVADGWLAHRSRAALRLERHAPAALALGETGTVTLAVENRTSRPLVYRLLDDVPPALFREEERVHGGRVPPGGTQRHLYRIRAETRGEAALGDLHLRLLGPLGLVWSQGRERHEERVQVHPGLREVRRYRLLGLPGRFDPEGARPVRRRGEGGTFESLREYVRGDDPRTIAWKASAHHGSLMVRQFEAERSQNVMIGIDAGRLMAERIDDRARIDHALAAALLLADVAAMHGDRVGVLVFADRVLDYLPPSRAPLARIAAALNDVQPRLVEPDYPAAFAYLGRQLRRRSLVVLFTDLIDARASSALLTHLAHAASRHLPLAVTLRNPELDRAATAPVEDEAGAYRRAAAEELLQARTHALTTMERAGILVADCRPGDAVPMVLNRYLEVKRRGGV